MKLIKGPDILALGEAMASLKRVGQMCDPKRREAAIKAGCMAADAHLVCSYPECKCRQIPAAVEAAIIAWEHHAPIPVGGGE